VPSFRNQSSRGYYRPWPSGRHSSAGDKILQRLCHLSAFSHLTKEVLQQIAEAGEFIEVKRKAAVYALGDDARNVFIVLSGAIKQGSSGARPVLIGIAGAGDIIGLQSLFEGGRHRFTAVALTSCKLARINADRFIDLMFTNQVDHLRRTLSMTIGPWLQTLERHPVLTAASVKVRLSVALLGLIRKFGTRDQRGVILNLPLTHALLADMIGATRPTVSKMVMDLERKGILVRDCRRFAVDVQALCQSADQDAQRTRETAQHGHIERFYLHSLIGAFEERPSSHPQDDGR
jgi:CRP/FNR family transcriptional regulator